jgi:hypothetical protein
MTGRFPCGASGHLGLASAARNFCHGPSAARPRFDGGEFAADLSASGAFVWKSAAVHQNAITKRDEKNAAYARPSACLTLARPKTWAGIASRRAEFVLAVPKLSAWSREMTIDCRVYPISLLTKSVAPWSKIAPSGKKRTTRRG